MREHAALLLAVALIACSRGDAEADGGETRADEPAKTAAGESDDSRIRCALAGAKAFEPQCLREIAQGDDGEIWVVRHPDGGFRRFVLIDQGRRIATADGAEEVRAERAGADLEVRVGRDRYLFPAAPEAPPSAHAT